jgi:hypothetical protein
MGRGAVVLPQISSNLASLKVIPESQLYNCSLGSQSEILKRGTDDRISGLCDCTQHHIGLDWTIQLISTIEPIL